LPRELGEAEASELGPEPELAFNPAASMVSEAGPPPATMPPAAGLRTWPQRPTRPDLTPARNFLKSRGTMSAARGTPKSDFALVSRAAPSVSQAEPGLFDDDQAKEPPIEARLQEPRIDPGEPATESGPRVTWPAELASIDAILSEDHLIEPDPALDARREGAKPSPEAIEPASVDPAPPFVAEALSPADPHEPSPPAVPASGEAGLAIVGRYESEGTSYVMYADGSIEARSERGVFHFQSMAELKAFMEAQA